jgi:hypothetical protein
VAAAQSAGALSEVLRKHGIALWVGPGVEYPDMYPQRRMWNLARDHSREVYRSGEWALYQLMKPEELRDARPRPVVGSAGLLDDLHPALAYDGPWYQDTQFAAAHSGTLQYCDRPACRLRLEFEGRRVTWIYTAAPNRGRAELKMDGQPAGTLDQYSSTTLWQQRHGVEWAQAGRHVLEIHVLGSRRPASAGAYVDVDAIEIH